MVPKDHRHKKGRRNLPKVLIWVRLSYFQIASSLVTNSKFQRQAAHGMVASRTALGLSKLAQKDPTGRWTHCLVGKQGCFLKTLKGKKHD